MKKRFRWGGLNGLYAVLLVTAVLLAPGCDDGGPPSLFPPFLPLVTHHRQLGEFFQTAAGDVWFVYTMRAPGVGTELVYIIQALPNGNRRLALLNSALQPVLTYDSPYMGGMHVFIDNNTHLAGQCVISYTGFFTTTITGAFVPQTTLGAPELHRDDQMVYHGGTALYYMLSPTTMVGNFTQVPSYTCNYSASYFNIQATSFNLLMEIEAMSRYFVLEGAGHNLTDVCLVFREPATNEGFLLPAPYYPGPINYGNFRPLGFISTGNVRFDQGGDPVVQTSDGWLTRYRKDGGLDLRTPGDHYNGYTIAYGQDDTMYLFNPDTLEIIKTRAWWRDYGN